MTEVDRLGWAVTVPLQAGGYTLGVRTNTPAVGALLAELFADRLVEGVAPPGNLSVLLAGRAQDGPQELHRLYVTYTRALRTRSASRTLQALWHELDVRDVEVERTRLQLDATTLVRDGQAYVLPAGVRRTVVDAQRRWSDAGFALVDRRRVDVDPVGATITIPPADLPLGPTALRERIEQHGVVDRNEAELPVGTLPIGGWVLPPAQRTLAGRVVDAAGQVVDRVAHDGVELVRGLSELLADLPDVVWITPDEVLAQLGR